MKTGPGIHKVNVKQDKRIYKKDMERGNGIIM